MRAPDAAPALPSYGNRGASTRLVGATPPQLRSGDLAKADDMTADLTPEPSRATLAATSVGGDEPPWESWHDPRLAAISAVRWRLVVSGDRTPTAGMSAGIAEIAPGGVLPLHRHAPPELYHVIEGQGVAEVEGTAHALRPGDIAVHPGQRPPPHQQHRPRAAALPVRVPDRPVRGRHLPFRGVEARAVRASCPSLRPKRAVARRATGCGRTTRRAPKRSGPAGRSSDSSATACGSNAASPYRQDPDLHRTRLGRCPSQSVSLPPAPSITGNSAAQSQTFMSASATMSIWPRASRP